MELKMPDLGEGVIEGEVARWLVNPGDDVKEEQVVLEVMTDKATVEIPSTVAGKVSELHFKEGEIVSVGQTLVSFGGAGGGAAKAKAQPETKSAAPAAATPAAASPAAAAAPVANGNGAANVQAAPAVRKAARERGINLSTILGSGPNGRILMSDLDSPTAAPAAAVASAPAAAREPQPSAPASAPAPTKPLPVYTPAGAATQEEERVPLRGMRKRIVEKMATSKRTAAHFTYVEECDITELYNFRKELKAEAEARGVKMTFMPFIIKAATIALKDFKELNAELREDGQGGGEVVYKKYYNVGMATDTPDGLTVPVIKEADRKSIFELAYDVGDLGARARDRKLTPQELQGGTFTITNAGNIGGVMATPVINYPEVAILGVHQIKKRPWVVGDEIKIRQIIWFSLSLDHRIVDGAVAARFMNRFVELIADPKKLMMEMR